MKLLARAALLAALSLLTLGSSAQAGPFGLFTASMFRPSYICCNCARPYNAFTPCGYNQDWSRIVPAATNCVQSAGTLPCVGCAEPAHHYPAQPVYQPAPAYPSVPGQGYESYPVGPGQPLQGFPPH